MRYKPKGSPGPLPAGADDPDFADQTADVVNDLAPLLLDTVRNQVEAEIRSTSWDKGYRPSYSYGGSDVRDGLKVLADSGPIDRTAAQLADQYQARGARLDALNLMEWWGRNEIKRQIPKYKDHADAVRRGEAFDRVFKATALEGQTGAQGGFAVPDVIGNEVLKLIRDASDVYSRSRQVQMSSDVLSYPDEATAVTTYWSNTQGTTLTGGEPVFGTKVLNAKKLFGRATFTLELLDDANVAIVPFLQSCFAEKMGGDLDYVAMEGNTTSGDAFVGVLTATSVSTVATTAATTGLTLTYQHLVNLFVAAGEKSTRDQGVYVMGPGVYSKIIGMTDTNGQPIVRLGAVEGQPNNTLLGRPMIVSNRMSTFTISTGTYSCGNLYFGPMSALVFGNRQGFRFDVSDQVNWATYRADCRLVGRFGYVVGVPTAWSMIKNVQFKTA